MYDQPSDRASSTKREYERAQNRERTRERSSSSRERTMPPSRSSARTRPDRARTQTSRRRASQTTAQAPAISIPQIDIRKISKINPIIPGVIIIVVFAAILFFGILPRCSGSSETDQQASNQAASTEPDESQESASSESQSGDGKTPQEDALKELLGNEEAEKLLKQAETDDDAYWIASHLEEFQFEDWDVYYKIIKLAADEPKSLKFVREYTEKYVMETADMSEDLAMDSSDLKGTQFETKVPHLYQWDRRWGNTSYSSAPFGLTGCGPTSIAMVYQAVTGKDDLSPYDMGVIANDNGYMSTFNGTGSDFFVFIANKYGISYTEMYYTSADEIRDLLKRGYVIIANLGPGTFTQTGHYFVLAGVADDGSIIINDPYSQVRSTQTWDAELIVGESIALFAFSK